jgi:predicted porin
LSVLSRYSLDTGELSARYARTHAPILGTAGLSEFEAIEFSIEYALSPSMVARAAPAYVRVGRAEATEIETYRLTLGFEYRLNAATSLFSGFEGYRQEGLADGDGDSSLDRNVMYVGIRHSFAPHASREERGR